MCSKRSVSTLQSLSKDELLKLLLEKCPEMFYETNFEEFNKKEKLEIKKKSARIFDPSAYPSRMVALKVAYFGLNYQGFASQTGLLNIFNEIKPATNSSVDTVEDQIFRALIRTRLILDPKTCNYSRCGRTDSGVSSTGQVVAIRLRTSNKKIPIVREQGPDQGVVESQCSTEETIDYASVLNKQLPDDIRVLDWAFVPENFSARFSCSSRKYHYYFAKEHYDNQCRKVVALDIEKMRIGADLLVGVHDFRNFCKRDASKPNQTFIREILECYIEEMPASGSRVFYRFVCKGSAFLYHQIRCIMSVLFMIGSGKEPIELIEKMLERIVSKSEIPSGPLIHYEIASEIPLTLYECSYEKTSSVPIEWVHNAKYSSFSSQLAWHLQRLYEAKQSEAFIIESLLRDVNNAVLEDEPKIINYGSLLKNLIEVSVSK